MGRPEPILHELEEHLCTECNYLETKADLERKRHYYCTAKARTLNVIEVYGYKYCACFPVKEAD